MFQKKKAYSKPIVELKPINSKQEAFANPNEAEYKGTSGSQVKMKADTQLEDSNSSEERKLPRDESDLKEILEEEDEASPDHKN